MSSSKAASADALRVQVKAQSEKIRQMKKAGVAQEEVMSEVQTLQILKAELEKLADAEQVGVPVRAELLRVGLGAAVVHPFGR